MKRGYRRQTRERWHFRMPGSFFVCIIMDANGWEEKVRRRFQKELVYGYIVAEHKLKENL